MTGKKRKKGPAAVACGHSVFVVEGDKGLARIEIRDFRIIERLVGTHLFSAFVRAFHGVERLDALIHLHMVNERANSDRNHPLAAHRNSWTVLLMMYGALYECIDALRRLSQAGVASQLPDQSESWEELRGMIRRWEKNETLKRMRHQFAHHLGDSSHINAGLDQFRTGKMMTVFDFNGGPYPNGYAFPFVSDVLLHGSGIMESDFERFVVEALADQLTLRTSVVRLFIDVLIFHGVQLEID